MPTRRLLPLLGLAVACAAQTTPGNLRIEPVEGSAAVWVAPGAAVELRVKVTSEEGTPRESASVVFLAPAQAPGGTFAGGDGTASTLRRAVTDSQGVAEVALGAGTSPGPFLVSAWIQGTSAVAHMAVSIVESGTGAALAPGAWTRAVRDQVEILPEAQLYGPFLLDGGTIVTTAGLPGKDNPERRLDRKTVFFWIDERPLASYGHPVRLVFLDADVPEPKLGADGVMQRRDWWPVVKRGDDGTPVSLVAPLFRIRRVVGWEGRAQSRRGNSLSGLMEAEEETFAARLAGGLRYAEPSETCVVIVFGPDSTAFENSAADIRSVCTGTLKIPEANIIEDTVDGTFGVSRQASTPTRIRELIKEKLAGKNCKKLIFYYAGHGYNGGFCPANETDADKNDEMDFMPYSELGDLLGDTKIPEIDVILQACHTGSAIPHMQAQGFSGTIATSAATDLLAYHNPIPGFRASFWTSALTQTWRDLATIEGQDISLNTVAQATGEGRDPNSYAMVGDPRVAPIEAQGGNATAPHLSIPNVDDPAENPKTLTVIAPPGFPDGDGTAEILIYNPSVANDKANIEVGTPGEQIARFRLTGGNREARFEIQGLKPGVTDYMLTFKDRDGKAYTGYGAIRVGAGYQLAPNPAVVYVGQTVTIRVSRGSELQASPESAKLTVTPADATSAAVASPGVSEIQFPPGSPEQSFQLRGLQTGTATFKVSDGKTTKTLTVTVVNLALVPNSVRLKVGETAKVELVRQGPSFTSPVVPVITVTPPAGAAFATITPASAPLPGNQQSLALTVLGVTAGSGTFTVSSPAEGVSLSLPVTVEGSGCTVPPILNADHTVKLDPAGHAPFLQIMRVVYNLSTSGTTVTLMPLGNVNLPGATGLLSQSTCSFTAQGRGTSAGFPNILTEYILTYDQAAGRWVGTVEVGKGGGLPQNQSITYNVVATLP